MLPHPLQHGEVLEGPEQWSPPAVPATDTTPFLLLRTTQPKWQPGTAGVLDFVAVVAAAPATFCLALAGEAGT